MDQSKARRLVDSFASDVSLSVLMWFGLDVMAVALDEIGTRLDQSASRTSLTVAAVGIERMRLYVFEHVVRDGELAFVYDEYINNSEDIDHTAIDAVIEFCREARDRSSGNQTKVLLRAIIGLCDWYMTDSQPQAHIARVMALDVVSEQWCIEHMAWLRQAHQLSGDRAVHLLYDGEYPISRDDFRIHDGAPQLMPFYIFRPGDVEATDWIRILGWLAIMWLMVAAIRFGSEILFILMF